MWLLTLVLLFERGEVLDQWTLAFKVKDAEQDRQSNQKLLHYYQYAKNQAISSIDAGNIADLNTLQSDCLRAF